ncbi:MAG: hypothetical protein JRG76_01110 [Deltaproteobacteria bacterium]|nr:hypothetical protein [Deltaproteobacteria bacterium]MBW2413082.1 hypothetical protein [Deltaproteobacteria bacterium]
MAKILGNLKPEDDYTHPLGPESNFNESMYFNFFDPAQGVGGFLRLGNRANEGHAEMTVTIYLPGGRVLFMFKRAQIEHNDAFDAGGCTFEVVEPSQKLRTVYEGSVVDLANPEDMVDPKKAFTENPRRRVKLDLLHDAVGPMYGGAKDSSESDLPAEQQFASAHYEQHMAVSGELDLGDGERLEIHGFGLRDHSWGPRYWQALQSYEWLTLNFGPDFGAMVSIVRRDADNHRKGGVIIRGDQLDPIEEAEITAEYAENGLYHRKVRADVKTRSGEELVFEGDVRGFIPLRNRREGLVTHIGEGMTEWRCGDRVGYGLSEFLSQVP